MSNAGGFINMLNTFRCIEAKNTTNGLLYFITEFAQDVLINHLLPSTFSFAFVLNNLVLSP